MTYFLNFTLFIVMAGFLLQKNPQPIGWAGVNIGINLGRLIPIYPLREASGRAPGFSAVQKHEKTNSLVSN